MRFAALYAVPFAPVLEESPTVVPFVSLSVHQPTKEKPVPPNDIPLYGLSPWAISHYGDTNTLSRNEYDFLCGDFLLAAPIYTAGATTRTVYLPASVNWYYYLQ